MLTSKTTRAMSAVAVHVGMQVPKPALHTGGRNDGHPKANLERRNTKLQARCSLVISCGYKGGWWLEETYLFNAGRVRADPRQRGVQERRREREQRGIRGS